ncbi:hypothetical protein [uncultured Mediterranean phage]|nr:hypothetical protein [uncultured Mediterranean phage]
MAHRGPARIPGADDRPTGRKPGGLVGDPGLSINVNQFGGQVGAALVSEGQKSFTLSQKFAKADRAAAVSSAKADYDAKITEFENGLEKRSDHRNFVNDHIGALGTVASQISSGLSGEVKAAFQTYVRSETPLSTARVRAAARKLMVSEANAKSFVQGTAAVGRALNAETIGEAEDIKKSYFEDEDSLAAANIKTTLAVAKAKLTFTDNVAKGQLSKIILANPFNPAAETAIKNLRPVLQAAASEQLDTARNSWIASENRTESRRIAAEKRIIKENNITARRDLLILLNKYDQNDDENRTEGLTAAEKLLEQTLLNSPATGVNAATLDFQKDTLDAFREGRISPPGALNEALIAINNEELVSEDDYRFEVLSHTDRLTVSRRLALKNAEGQKHFSAQDFWKQGNDLIRARIEAANPIAPNAADNAVLKNQIAVKVKLAQGLYSARAYDAKDRGDMMQDVANLREGKYNVFNEVEEIVNIAASPSSAEIQIKALIEEKRVVLDKIQKQLMEPVERAMDLVEALSREGDGAVQVPEITEVGKVDPALQSRVTFLDQRINILNSLGTSPETPAAGLQSRTRVNQ